MPVRVELRSVGGQPPPADNPHSYTCGWCDTAVSSVLGFQAFDPAGRVVALLRFCPGCGHPSYLEEGGGATPGLPYGDEVDDLPGELGALYGEARKCISVNAHHAAVMVARKILMHVAVAQGADEGKTFAAYVDYLVSNNLVPPGTKDWVDEVRQIGNDANHEIFDIDAQDARTAIDFTAMLLKLLYEFPARGQRSVATRQAKDAGAAPTA